MDTWFSFTFQLTSNITIRYFIDLHFSNQIVLCPLSTQLSPKVIFASTQEKGQTDKDSSLNSKYICRHYYSEQFVMRIARFVKRREILCY